MKQSTEQRVYHSAYQKAGFAILIAFLALFLLHWTEPAYAQTEVTVSKELNSSGSLQPGQPISFTISITNTSSGVMSSLVVTDTYDTNYLAFNSVLGASIAPDNNVNDGQLNWSNLLATTGPLAIGESVSVVVNYTTVDNTENSVGCTGTQEFTCNSVTVETPSGSTYSSAIDILIEPSEGKYKIGDVVWHDLNNDGSQDANEPGVNGVLVHLYEDKNTNGTIEITDEYIISTTTTISNGVDGFYQFDKIIGDKSYIVQLDPANFAPGGPLEGFIVSDSATNPTEYTQFVPAVSTDRFDIDFGLYCRFDLALRKTLAVGQSTSIQPGDDVIFTLTVFNQGVVTAANITLVDYIPTGFTLSVNDPNNWTDNGTTATRSLPGTLGPSQSVSVNIQLTADIGLSGTSINAAEITDATDENGTPLTDEDSTPDDTNGNGDGEGPDLEDDQINEDGKNNPNEDEDDHDIAPINVEPFDLALRKTLASGQSSAIRAGTDVTFTLTVFNQGGVTATNISLIDYLPAGFTLSVNDSNGWSSNGITATRTLPGLLAPGQSTSVNLRLTADLGLNGTSINSAEITDATDEDGNRPPDVDSTPDDQDGNDPGERNPDIEDDEIDEDGKNNPGDDEDDHDIGPIIVEPFDLALRKTLASGQRPSIQPGEDVTFTLTVFNQGVVTAANILLVDYLPAGFTLSINDTNNWSSNGITATRMLPGTLAPGQSTNVNIRLTAGLALNGTSINSAEIADATDEEGNRPPDVDSTPDDQDGNDPGETNPDLDDDEINEDGKNNPGDDEDDHDIGPILVEPFDLALRKTLATGQASIIRPGDDVVFTLTVFNQGVVTAANISLIDYLPTDFTLSVNDTNNWSSNGVTATRTLPGTLAPGQSTSINIRLTAGAALSGMSINAAEISSSTDENGTPLTDTDSTPDDTNGNGDGEGPDLEDDQINEDGKNNPNEDEDDHDIAPITIELYDLSLIKELAPGQSSFVEVNDVVRYVITVKNQGTINSGRITVSDQIPAGMSYAGALARASAVVATPGVEIIGVTNQNFTTVFTDLVPSATGVITLDLRVTDPTQAPFRNWAEISIDDGDDADSVPGDNNGNDNGPGVGNPAGDPVVDHDDIDHNPPNDNPAVDEDDSDYEDVNITGTPSLEVTKTLNQQNPFGIGELINFTIRIANTGDVPLTVVPLEDRYNDAFIEFVSAGVTPDLSSGGGVLAWSDLTTALGNIAPNASISVNVTFRTKADTLQLNAIPPCLSDGHTPNYVEVNNARADFDGDDGNLADDIPVVRDGDDEDCAEVQILMPTAVQLASQSMNQTSAGVVLRWSTVNESDVVGFYIWKSNGLDAEVRSNEMVTALNPGASNGSSYEWLDAGETLTSGDAYVLEIVKGDGTNIRTVIDVMTDGGSIFMPFIAQ
ncbi:MAG: SdrD B-like domain-containing protein [Chloroflexota bacterium]